MWMDGAPVLIRSISFLNSVLLTDVRSCIFMLKNDIQNYFRKFTKILSEKFYF